MTYPQVSRTYAATVTAAAGLAAGKHTPVDTSGGAVTVTLPTPGNADAYLSVEKVDSSLNAVTISGSIRGATATITLTAQYQTAELHWDGGTWRVISGYGTPYAAASNGTNATTTDPTVTSDSTAGYGVGSQWVNTSTKAAFECLDATAGAAVWRRLTADVQIFTASGTWTQPAWVTTVEVAMIGGGAGGASGGRFASGTASSGGAGGGGGGYFRTVVPASSLGATETVTVGAGGTGGAAVTVDSTAGNPGGQPTLSTFGTRFRSGSFPSAPGGGAAGAVSAAGAGGTSLATGSSGGQGNSSGTGNNGAGNNSGAAAGGGGGGGVSATPGPQPGGTGGSASLVTSSGLSGGTAGSAGGGPGGAGPAVTLIGLVMGGAGGGGGGGATTTAGGTGGAGGGYGAGGGGGGSSLNGFTSGAGGNGGPGIVVVISR